MNLTALGVTQHQNKNDGIIVIYHCANQVCDYLLDDSMYLETEFP